MLTPLQIATLGVLAEEPRHPYDCYRLLMHRRADRVVRIKTGTLYHAIRRLEAQGLVAEVGTDRDGNRPERTTYRITDDGRTTLEEQLRTMLAEPEQQPAAVAAEPAPASGLFWHDRRARPIDLVPTTRAGQDVRAAAWAWLGEAADLAAASRREG